MGPGELSPRWRGVHHLALITPDMDATVRFWCGALGARLVATLATESFRHYFFEFGPGIDGRVLRVHGRRPRLLRQARRCPHPAGVAVRPPVAGPARRRRPARPAVAPEGGGL